MSNPMRETTLPNSAGSYHVRNLFGYDDNGLCAILDGNSFSPLNAKGQEVHILSTTFKRTIYNLKVAELANFYIASNGLLVKGI